MGKYALQALCRAAIDNFDRRIFTFRMFGKIDVSIRHMHHNEYGVIVWDPVANADVEVIRLINNNGRVYAAA